MRRARPEEQRAINGLNTLGGYAAAGLFYYLFGPRCRSKRCNALLPPGASMCHICGRKL